MTSRSSDDTPYTPLRYGDEPPVTKEGADVGTRLGRVQLAWWIQDHGGDSIIVSQDERLAYSDALAGDDMDIEGAACLVRFVGRLDVGHES